MKDLESNTEYHSSVMVVVNQLRRNGEVLLDVTMMEKIMRSLHLKFDYVVPTTAEIHDLEEMSIEEIMGSLQVYKKHMQQRSSSASIKQALELRLTLGDQRSGRGNLGPHRGDRGRGRG